MLLSEGAGRMSEAIALLRRRGRPALAQSGPSEGVQSLDRAVGLLERLAAAGGLGVSDLARQAELPASTVHRLLATLSRRRLVAQDPVTGRWNVGVGMFRIGSAYLKVRRLPEIARPIAHSLREEVGETVTVSMLDRRELVCVAQAESHAPVRAFFRLGSRLPLHASAGGKAILAAGSQAFQRELLRETSLERYTAATIAHEDALAVELRRVRRRGWAIDDEEYAVGMRCVSVAIRNEWLEPVGAISISGPTARVSADRIEALGAAVRAAALTLSEMYSGLRPK